jgi:hypothetical protein
VYWQGETDEMGVLDLLNYRYVVQLDVEILIYTFERSADLNVVLEFHRHLMVNQRLEKAAGAISTGSGSLGKSAQRQVPEEKHDED